MSRVSVIIPCFNPGKYILETIRSVENQSFKDYEIIIVDDESTDDDTLQSLKELEIHEKLTVLHQKNSGPGIARNIGVENALGEFIVLLDADDLIRKETINIALEIFEKYPDVGVVYGDIQLFQNKNELRIQKPFDLRKMFNSNQITVLSVMRKQTFIDSGGYDHFTSVHGFVEDYDLWLCIAETKWKFHYVNKILFDYRILADSRTSRNFNERDLALQHIYQKHSKLLHKEFLTLYHENKNFKKTIDYRIGNLILKPLRALNSLKKLNGNQ